MARIGATFSMCMHLRRQVVHRRVVTSTGELRCHTAAAVSRAGAPSGMQGVRGEAP